MDAEKEFDTTYTDKIVCPYCGIEQDESHLCHDKDETIQQCVECNKEFHLNVYVIVNYSTHKIVKGGVYDKS